MFKWQKEGDFFVPQELQRQMTQTTPTPPDTATTTGILGLILLFGDLDFGDVPDFRPVPEIGTVPLNSVRTAVQTKVAEETTSVAVNFTFGTHNWGDPDILEIWHGGGVFATTEGPLKVINNGKVGKKGLLTDFPKVSIRGNGSEGAYGTEFYRLLFTGTGLLEAGSESLFNVGYIAAVAPTP